MRHLKFLTAALLAFGAGDGSATAADCADAPVPEGSWRTEHIIMADDRAELARRVDDLSWLVGHWRGEGLGGLAEYHFAPPSHGSIAGTFKHSRDGRINFYELVVISEFDGRTAVRLKHFGSDLSGWEAADEWLEYPLIALVPGCAAYFDGLTYRSTDDGVLYAHVVARGRDGGGESELTFRFDKAQRFPDPEETR